MYPTSSIIESIHSLNQVEDGPRVDELLSANPPLSNWLLQIPPQLNRYFHHAVLTLKPYTYFDTQQGHSGLFVGIRTALPLEQADTQLTQFDRAWWIEAKRAIGGSIIVDIEPVIQKVS